MDKQEGWLSFYQDWLTESERQSLDVFILYYADLINNFNTSIINLAHFFGFEMTPSHQQCVVENREGLFHRPGTLKKPPFSGEDRITKQVIEKLKSRVIDCVRKQRCATSGSDWRL